MFLDHAQRRSTVGRTPLDEWSARRKDLYLTTHNTHNRQSSMPPVGFEPTISAGEWPQTYALDRVATGTGIYIHIDFYNILLCEYIYIYNFIIISAWNNTIKLHVQSSWGWTLGCVETCRRQYNWIKSLMRKVRILLVPPILVYHNARFNKHETSDGV